MLSIRDEQVRSLALNLMEKTGAPTITAAIRLALENETARVEERTTLQEKVEMIRKKALAVAIRPPQPPLTKAERDDLWDR
jgi:antitoxin VapB